MTTKEFKRLLQAFEAGGRQALGVELPTAVAKQLRHELHHLYGLDPGEELMTLFGVEVLSVNADKLRFVE